jgi:hypothetical protein
MLSFPTHANRTLVLRRGKLAAALAAVALALSGCGGSYSRTEVLRSTWEGSDVYLRITGPEGAVHYLSQRLRQAQLFDRFKFKETSSKEGVFLPPTVRERKLCASTHMIKSYDAPQLQRWRGKTLAVTVYGKEISRIFCAGLTWNLYVGN